MPNSKYQSVSGRYPGLASVMLGLLATLCCYSTSLATLRESFESPEPTWRLVDSDCSTRPIIARRRSFRTAHTGNGSEHVQVAARGGSYVYMAHDIQQAPVIDELVPSLWVKGDRPGIQLLARVVLPRSVDPRSGRPLTTFIRGTSYDAVGTWQRLVIEDVGRLLDRQVQLLRSHEQFPHVDAAGAYVDLIVLNAYGGPGVTNVWIDDMEVPVHVLAAGTDVAPAQYTSGSQRQADGPSLTAAADSQRRGMATVQVQGSLLMVDQRPVMVRAVQHQGESFQLLKSLGFNAVRLPDVATQAQLDEAERLDMWLVAPPPQRRGQPAITPRMDRVLVWELGHGVTRRELDAVRQLSKDVRLADEVRRRPLLCAPATRLEDYARTSDILLLEKLPLGTEDDLAEYGAWLRQQQQIARRGGPVWATIQTEPHRAVIQQRTALAGTSDDGHYVDPQQIRLLTYSAVAAGVRGLCFQSQTPLDTDNPATQLRARTLQLLNRELQMIEPWIAAGEYVEQLEVGDSQLQAHVLQTERARLVIVLRHSPRQQYAVAPPVSETMSFVMHGTPITDQAYRLGASGIEKLRSQRGGGLHLTLDDGDLVSLVVLTQDPLVVNHLERQLQASRAEASQLRYEIAARWLAFCQRDAQALAGHAPAVPVARWLQDAQGNLRQSGLMLQAEDYAEANRYARQVMHALAAVRRSHWEFAIRGFASPVISPLCVSFATLRDHWELASRLQNQTWGPDALAAGDMEDLKHMRQSGWRQYRADDSDKHVHVELSFDQPRAGRAALHLQAWRDAGTAVDAEPPVWITTAPIPVAEGQLVRIQGWVQVAAADESAGSLSIFDNWGGLPLAQRIGPTSGWRPFTLYRAAPRSGELLVTFALHGAGDVWLDDVSVTLLDAPPAATTAAR